MRPIEWLVVIDVVVVGWLLLSEPPPCRPMDTAKIERHGTNITLPLGCADARAWSRINELIADKPTTIKGAQR